ncbi:MAG: hypothetical protein ABI425_00825 [Patescibacteria group bacterium]
MPKSTTLLLSVAIVSSVLLAACQPQPSSSDQTVTPEVTAEMTPAPTQKTSEGMTKGKEVSVTTKYQSPAGEEAVGFTLVLDENGIISDAKTEIHGLKPISVDRQTKFAEGLPAVIKGKKLSELTNIDRVGGSSLTTNAFNASLQDLKAQI